jgi:hypothetical protein
MYFLESALTAGVEPTLELRHLIWLVVKLASALSNSQTATLTDRSTKQRHAVWVGCCGEMRVICKKISSSSFVWILYLHIIYSHLIFRNFFRLRGHFEHVYEHESLTFSFGPNFAIEPVQFTYPSQLFDFNLSTYP